MRTHFQQIYPNYGFDDSIRPAWLMVPLNDRKPILVYDAEGMTVTSRTPGIVKLVYVKKKDPVPQEPYRYSSSVELEENSHVHAIALFGNAPGRTYLELKKGNKVIELLEVSVRPKITLKLAFNFVSDKFSSTKQTESNLDEIMMILNQIYIEQTNIEFVNNKVSYLKFDRDFKTAVNHRLDDYGKVLPGHDTDLIISRRDKTSHLNVFFVWRVEYTAKNSHAWGLALNEDRACFIDDEVLSPFPAAQTIAHEIGHLLGIADLSKTKLVKNPDTDKFERITVNADKYALGYGTFIPRHQSNIMWEIAGQIAGKK